MNEQRGPRGHKDLQVCRQVFDALSYALAELDDPVAEAPLETWLADHPAR